MFLKIIYLQFLIKKVLFNSTRGDEAFCNFLIKMNGQTRGGGGQSVTQQLWLEEYNCVVDMSAKQLTRVHDSPATERVICLQRGGGKG